MTYLYGATLSNGTVANVYVPSQATAKERSEEAMRLAGLIAEKMDAEVLNVVELQGFLDPNKEVLDPEETAYLLGYGTRDNVYRLGLSGKLPAATVGNRTLRFVKADLLRDLRKTVPK